MSAASLSTKEGARAVGHLKHLMNNVPATFVLIGVELEKTPLLASNSHSEQLSGRLTVYRNDLLKIHHNEEIRTWRSVIRALERNLVLYNHPADSLANSHWKYSTIGRAVASRRSAFFCD